MIFNHLTCVPFGKSVAFTCEVTVTFFVKAPLFARVLCD